MDELINTLSNPGEFDALTSLRQDEPYFVLVGRDRFAPPLIYEWADRNRRRALKEFDEGLITKELRDREMRKSTQAEMIAAAMVEFKNKWQAIKDEERPVTTYSGHEMPEHVKRRDTLQSQRVAASRACSNAVGELADLVALLDRQEAEEADEANLIDDTIDELKKLAAELTPDPRKAIAAPAPLLDQ